MAKQHAISWLNWPGYKGESWNPIVGCSKCSHGCQNCYAEQMACRLAAMGLKQYIDVIDPDAMAWNGKTAFVESALEKPLHWKQTRCIFVCDMGDLFHVSVPFEWVDKVFAVMARCPQHKFLLLTKRPDRMAEYIELLCKGECAPIPHLPSGRVLPNVGLGVTVCNQEEADKKIPTLLEIPAAMRFVSIEPMLEGINLRRLSTDVYCLACSGPSDCNWEGYSKELLPITPEALEEDDDPDDITGACPKCGSAAMFGASTKGINITGLDWVIAGGESGAGARPMSPAWARSLRDQCKYAGVPFFFKQWGTSPQYNNLPALEGQALIESGWNPAGKKGGPLLDGVEYHEFPEW